MQAVSENLGVAGRQRTCEKGEKWIQHLQLLSRCVVKLAPLEGRTQNLPKRNIMSADAYTIPRIIIDPCGVSCLCYTVNDEAKS